MLVKDLYFVNEGCATVIPSNGHLNFDKFNRLGQRLSEFAQWKNVECPYDKLSAIADFLQCYPIYSEEGKLLKGNYSMEIRLLKDRPFLM